MIKNFLMIGEIILGEINLEQNIYICRLFKYNFSFEPYLLYLSEEKRKLLKKFRALRSKISSLVYKRFKYLNILIIITMFSGYLPNSPIMANDVDRFPTPDMYLQNFRWTCSCFKLLNSYNRGLKALYKMTD
jgi:Sec-independent protein secretion pathway component TatC